MGIHATILTKKGGHMRRAGAVLAGIAIGAGGLGFTALAPIGSALAQEQKGGGGGNTVRPEIGKPVQDELIARTEYEGI